MDRKPPWLRAKIPGGPEYAKVRDLVKGNKLHTVCESAHCPNLGECWSRGTATIMILGETCTRSCRFCAIATGKPGEVDFGEPARVADAVRIMGLKHAVITSVARDDLPDGGAEIWARTVRAVKHVNPETHIEVLIPDFKGEEKSLNIVLDADPDILNHNMETVRRLQKPVRVQARYDRSREVLQRAKDRGFVTKTGLMLGIGEREEEMKVDILTLGQYLRPTEKHLPIDRWVTPEEFARWKERALELGFGVCESGPLVRSSYHAEEQSAKYTGWTPTQVGVGAG